MNKLFVLIFLTVLGDSIASWQNQKMNFNIKPNGPLPTQQNLPMNGFTPRVSFNENFQVALSGIPYPECVNTERAAALLNPQSISQLFAAELQREEAKLKNEKDKNEQINHSRKI